MNQYAPVPMPWWYVVKLVSRLRAVGRGPGHDVLVLQPGQFGPVPGHPDVPAVGTADDRHAVGRGPGTETVALSVPHQNPVGLSLAEAVVAATIVTAAVVASARAMQAGERQPDRFMMPPRDLSATPLSSMTARRRLTVGRRRFIAQDHCNGDRRGTGRPQSGQGAAGRAGSRRRVR